MRSDLILPLLSALTAAQTPYSQYILTPTQRDIHPTSVYNVNGTVNNANALTSDGVAVFQDESAVTYDFGKNIGGIVSFNVSNVQGSDQYIGISFTESSLWINSEGCDATADAGIDEALWFRVSTGGSYRAFKEHQRGGFRYLNVYHNSTGSVEITGLSVYFTAIPQVEQLGAYTGYFHTNDEQLNRVWYAGAYTNELCTIDPTAGDSLIYLETINKTSTITEPLPWYVNYTIANGSSVLVDGPKRDRLVWPGDMAIAVPSIAVSTYELSTIKNSLDSLLALQNQSTGALPYAGRPFSFVVTSFSFTYHLYSLIGIYDYFLYSGDLDYVEENWNTYVFALNYSLSFIDDSGLMNVTTSADWLRDGMGGHNIEANAILYNVLNQGMYLGDVLNDTSVSRWGRIASRIKQAAYDRLWDPDANLYRDNDTRPLTDLHPQDGNSWAVVSGLTKSSEQSSNISSALAARWGKYGAPAPEAGETVSPFISSFELQAHYIAEHPERAVKLMKFMWGDFMLDDPRMTNSTFIEGYSTNGDLHYAPYNNDPRISHAHGWATGPTGSLTYYAAGLQILTASGKTWRIAPSLGGLENAEAGYSTSLGHFSSNVTGTDGGVRVKFSTPTDTMGSLSLRYPGQAATLKLTGGCRDITLQLPAGGEGRFEIGNLSGGNYTATLTPS
jgi:hypothetical protein